MDANECVNDQNYRETGCWGCRDMERKEEGGQNGRSFLASWERAIVHIAPSNCTGFALDDHDGLDREIMIPDGPSASGWTKGGSPMAPLSSLSRFPKVAQTVGRIVGCEINTIEFL